MLLKTLYSFCALCIFFVYSGKRIWSLSCSHSFPMTSFLWCSHDIFSCNSNQPINLFWWWNLIILWFFHREEPEKQVFFQCKMCFSSKKIQHLCGILKTREEKKKHELQCIFPNYILLFVSLNTVPKA
jgi:hypothetical protein